MKRLTNAAELLDGPLNDAAALDGNLRDLRRINRWLGGVALSAAAIESLAAHRVELSLLDVGTGGADIPVALIELARKRGRRVHAIGIDARPEILAAAVRIRPAIATIGGLELRVGDGRALAFPDRTFDVAHISLVLHHLEPSAAIDLLRELGRVARLGVVVNDLERSRLGWIGAWLLGHLFTANRYTRHDASLSVRRAYRRHETAALLRDAGLVPVRTHRGAFGQRYGIAAVVPTPVLELTPDGSPDPIGAGE